MIKLGVILDSGSHVAAWRHPSVPGDAAWSFRHMVSLAQTAERGLLDMVFFADSLATRRAPDAEIASLAEPAKHLEPITLLAGMAAVTSHVGLVATATTTYYEPYHLARFFGSLDLISEGRAGWNLVTSMNEDEALNFGHPNHPPHAERYDRATEFARVVLGLWDSWDDDAFLHDKATSRYFDPAGLQILDHKGAHFEVKGPLNLPRSPQGRPVITQAGSSEAGKELGAETADVIFTAQHDLETAKRFYADVKARLPRFGRAAGDLKIMAGIVPIIGRTREEAEAQRALLGELIHPDIGLAVLSALLGGVDLSGHDLDGPLPPLPVSNSSQSRQALLIELARRDNLSIRQLYQHACSANGHRTLTGTAEDIADELEAWYREGAVDGFVLIPPFLPVALDDFVDQVVPILQRRGLFRTAYEGRTLRENLGLPRPAFKRRTALAAE
jgi:alkanesulfonate monooxygenase